MSASCPNGASFTWKSILYGRGLLREGMVWRIGDGSKVNAWQDNWIPRDSVKSPLGHKPDQVVQKVEELLLPDGAGWNVEKLNDVFFDGDVTDILKIPVGRAGTSDYIAWNYTKNGISSVKSTYHLKQSLKRAKNPRPSPSSSLDEHHGWLSLWAANVPGKVQVHCWRLAKNVLAIGDELRRRHIKDGVKCVACNRVETVLHRFWECPHSACVWEALRSLTSLSLAAPAGVSRSFNALQGWLLDWFGALDEKELAISLMALYQLWLARNEARDKPMIEDPEITARRIVALVEEWQAVSLVPSQTNTRAVQ
jgi:hypothetical protein